MNVSDGNDRVTGLVQCPYGINSKNRDTCNTPHVVSMLFFFFFSRLSYSSCTHPHIVVLLSKTLLSHTVTIKFVIVVKALLCQNSISLSLELRTHIDPYTTQLFNNRIDIFSDTAERRVLCTLGSFTLTCICY